MVPVFWLQTEDHDLKEIATIQVGRPQGEPLTPSLPSSPADRVSVAHATLAGELLAALEADPLSFSSSALLRPVVQDTLPPTAAYVGGPAEVAYFAQLGPLYEVYGLPRPLVVPRARFRVVDEKTAAGVRGSVQ